MENGIKAGDLVLSKAGRDSGEIFLVIFVDEKHAFIVDGKCRKVRNPKKKKIKHLKRVSVAGLIELAIQIRSGKPVGNERLYRAIKTAKQKIQED